MIGWNGEFKVGGILFAPFVGYVLAALVIFLLLRTGARLVHFDRYFANPPLAAAAIYVCILGLLMVLT